MYRKDLPKDEGMLFKFPNPLNASFWGMNTYIPLDLAFVGPDMKISEITYITPLSTKAVKSKDICSIAIEANAGYFKNNDINVGQKIKLIGSEVYFD